MVLLVVEVAGMGVVVIRKIMVIMLVVEVVQVLLVM